MSKTLKDSGLINPLTPLPAPASKTTLETFVAASTSETAAIPSSYKLPQRAFVKTSKGKFIPVSVNFASRTCLPIPKDGL